MSSVTGKKSVRILSGNSGGTAEAEELPSLFEDGSSCFFDVSLFDKQRKEKDQ